MAARPDQGGEPSKNTSKTREGGEADPQQGTSQGNEPESIEEERDEDETDLHNFSFEDFKDAMKNDEILREVYYSTQKSPELVKQIKEKTQASSSPKEDGEMPKNAFRIGSWNIGRGIVSRDKVSVVEQLFEDQNLDLLFIQECDLDQKKDSPFVNFITIWQDLEEVEDECKSKRGRLVPAKILCLIRKREGIEVSKIELNSNVPKAGVHSVWLKVKLDGDSQQSLVVSGYYRWRGRVWDRKKLRSGTMEAQQERFDNYLEQIKRIGFESGEEKVILVGDFNLDWTKWKDKNFQDKKLCDNFNQLLKEKKMVNHMKENSEIVTRGENSPDQVCYTISLKDFVHVSVVPNERSDHDPIVVTYNPSSKP